MSPLGLSRWLQASSLLLAFLDGCGTGSEASKGATDDGTNLTNGTTTTGSTTSGSASTSATTGSVSSTDSSTSAAAGGPTTSSTTTGSTTAGSTTTGSATTDGGMTTAGPTGAGGTGGVDSTVSSAGGAGGVSSASTGGGGTGGGAPDILGATPPMGWNSWNAFACDGLNESVVKSMADAFVSTGMADVGYEYVNLDDCWMDGRDGEGKLKWNTSKFPSGIPALADYVHGLGLKIGIYETPNTQTCAGIYGGYTPGVGSLGHETTDAQTFAEWGIDYLKYDKCRGELSAFAVMRDALRATGRPIFFSINPGDQGPYCTPTNCSIDLPQIANMWRIEFDIAPTWGDVVRLIDANKNEYSGAGPGHWNDPDMLEVGNGLNDTEGRAHFSMWAIMASPLITGNDLTKMSATTLETLTNEEVIAVNQDRLGAQGRVVATPGSNLEVWSKEMSGTNVRAVALFNRSSGNASITVQWSDIGIPAGQASVRDLWAKQDLGSFTGSYTASNVPSHSVVMLKVVGSS